MGLREKLVIGACIVSGTSVLGALGINLYNGIAHISKKIK